MKKEPLPNFKKNRTLEEIQQIRNQRDSNQERITAFNKAATTHDEPGNRHTLITVIHPDGITNMPITNNDELANAILAAYADGHGDFGIYGNGQPEPDRGDKQPEAVYGAREKEYRRAVHFLERHEQRGGGPVNPYDHNENQFIRIDDNGVPQLCGKPMSADYQEKLEDAQRIADAFELDYQAEPWDSLEPPTYEQIEARETAYSMEQKERLNEEAYAETIRKEEEIETYAWLQQRFETEGRLKDIDDDLER